MVNSLPRSFTLLHILIHTCTTKPFWSGLLGIIIRNQPLFSSPCCAYEVNLKEKKKKKQGVGRLKWGGEVDLRVWLGKKGLPLFIKPRQIQLACGLPSNPINLLSCESTQQLLPISHFSQPLIRSAQDIQWGSLQLHLWCSSCHRGFKTTASVLISPSLRLSLFPVRLQSLFFIFFFAFLSFTQLLNHLAIILFPVIIIFLSFSCLTFFKQNRLRSHRPTRLPVLSPSQSSVM